MSFASPGCRFAEVETAAGVKTAADAAVDANAGADVEAPIAAGVNFEPLLLSSFGLEAKKRFESFFPSFDS